LDLGRRIADLDPAGFSRGDGRDDHGEATVGVVALTASASSEPPSCSERDQRRASPLLSCSTDKVRF
jgi:hypothetical protein